jgi:GNAT superfamily N-acetyltransferase
MTSLYSIREIDGFDGGIALELEGLHAVTFPDAPKINPELGHWWFVYRGRELAGFAGMCKHEDPARTGYLERAGVLRAHRGHRLQLRLIRVRERRARKNGWNSIVTDCTADNSASANNLIRAGYQVFVPKFMWSWKKKSIYWRKSL